MRRSWRWAIFVSWTLIEFKITLKKLQLTSDETSAKSNHHRNVFDVSQSVQWHVCRHDLHERYLSKFRLQHESQRVVNYRRGNSTGWRLCGDALRGALRTKGSINHRLSDYLNIFVLDSDDDVVLRSFRLSLCVSNVLVPEVNRQRHEQSIVDSRREPFTGDFHRINRNHCFAICHHNWTFTEQSMTNFHLHN